MNYIYISFVNLNIDNFIQQTSYSLDVQQFAPEHVPSRKESIVFQPSLFQVPC